MVLSEELREKIIFAHGQGKSPTEIADELNLCLRTVQRWIARFVSTGRMQVAPKSGRPRCTTAETDAQIIEISEQNPQSSSTAMRAALEQVEDFDEFDASPSSRTIRRRLHESGLVLRTLRCRDVALSKPATQAKRLEWAEQMVREWDGWADRTVYVDESTFESCSRFVAKAWTRSYLRGRGTQWVKVSGRVSVGLFGGLCEGELLPPYIVCGKFTADQYRDVLNELYLPVMNQKFGDDEWRFQQDNSPVHRGAAVTEWLDTEPDFRDRIMFQPPNPTLLISTRSSM